MVIKFTLFAARSSKSGKKYPHYYFCAEGRRKAFMENPGKFIEAQCAKPKNWWGRYIARLNKATRGKALKCH